MSLCMDVWTIALSLFPCMFEVANVRTLMENHMEKAEIGPQTHKKNPEWLRKGNRKPVINILHLKQILEGVLVFMWIQICSLSIVGMILQ